MKKRVISSMKLTWRYLIALLVGLLLFWQQPFNTAQAADQRVKITSGSNYLIVEAMNDNLIHFELSAFGPGPSTRIPIYTSPMVYKTNYPGPTSWSDTTSGGVRTLQTPNTRVDVNTTTLCATVIDKVRSITLTTYCPLNLNQAWKGMTMTRETFTHGYGLGAEYILPGTADGDWVSTPGHQVRTPGDYGNEMKEFDNGGTSNTQYPVLYMLGSGDNNYAMFLDNYYKQQWNFTANPGKVEMWGDWIRWYVFTGADFPTLRKSYMELTGRPPVPPKKSFGLWVSTFGYHNWDEIDTRLTTLKSNSFPVDGFVLDLYWFGGICANSPDTPIGRLTWDTNPGFDACTGSVKNSGYFPNPAAKLAAYKTSDGIGIILIEESLIGRNTQSWTDLSSANHLVLDGCSSGPTLIDKSTDSTDNDFFGDVGIIDWTDTVGADWWFDHRRLALINDGVFGHWLDLNEPEGNSKSRLYDPDDCYDGFDPHGPGGTNLRNEADIHNMFAFSQAQSIARGYTRKRLTQRPFMMSRSGAPGIQRFGATQWSADIAPKFTSLATWNNVQMHMTLSGMDYYSSDLGGFRRKDCSQFDCTTGFDQLYTQWYATGMMFDIPGRPHSDDIRKETSPAAIGRVDSNRANTQRRYELIPYTYTLAYRAYLYGEPVVPPLVYYYQTDPNARMMGHEKLIGRDLLAGIVAGYDEFKRDIYLPAGDWVSFDTNEWFHSTGQTFAGLPEYREGIFRLPLFARAGAIIPTMYVDNQTGNALGFRRDGSTHNGLIARVYANPTASNFTLYEDDGQTTAYQSGTYRTTLLSQQKDTSTSETVTIAASSGNYAGAPSSRNNVVLLVVENQRATAATLNGVALPQYTTKAQFDAASSGWWNAGYNIIQAKSGSMNVTTAKMFAFTLTSAPAQASVNFVCKNGTTVPGQSVFVVGNIPQLGSFNPANAIKLDPNVYPIWTGIIQNLPTNTGIAWKCIKRNNNDTGNLVWEPNGPGPNGNNFITTPGSGYGASTTDGGF